MSASEKDQPQAAAAASQPAVKTYEVAFFRAPFYRLVQADGAWGRISPSGFIHMSFFNDCDPLPDREYHDVGPDGRLGEMKLQLPPNVNLVRQIEVDVVLSLEAAKRVRANLDNFIEIVEKLKPPANP